MEVRRASAAESPETTIEDLNEISGKPWAPTGVLTETVILPRAESYTALKEKDESLTSGPEVKDSSPKPSSSTLDTQRHALCVVHNAGVSMARRYQTPESVVNNGSVLLKTQLSKRERDDVEERK